MEFKLIKKLLELSESKVWDLAKKEWEIASIVYLEEDDYEECLCGHTPIKKVITIQNRLTTANTIVGKCCINKIFDLTFNKSFNALRKGKVNAEILEFAYSKGLINQKSYEFALDVWRKRYLTDKQQKWFDNIKEIIFKNLKGGYQNENTNNKVCAN